MRIIFTFIALIIGLGLKAQQVLVFTHDYYSSFEKELQEPGKNFHTAVKPYLKSEVDSLENLEKMENALLMKFRGKFMKHLFNRHLISVDQKDFKFSVDPVVNWTLAYDDEVSLINLRGFWVRGEIGQKISFQSTFYETQARYADYVNRWIDENGVIPGQGKFKFEEDLGGLYDFQWSGGYVNYQPSKFFNIQFGQGKHFFGDGYRSLFLSDNSFNYPFLKITTTVWNIKYVNLYTAYSDIRQEVRQGLLHPRKYATTHFLSWNLGKRLNINAFETVVWHDTLGTRGYDIAYLNPIIFFRPVDFSLGSPDNVLLGGGAKFKLTRNAQAYGQLLLDEFRFDEIVAGNGWWANKFGMQLGIKVYDLMNVDGLYAQAEFNTVRPFTYSHKFVTQNYAHYNQALAHPLGSNFKEGLLILRYVKKRWNFELEAMYAKKGLDTDSTNMGGDLYQSYSTRSQEYDNIIGQGVPLNIGLVKCRAGYVLNPRYNLQLEAGMTLRKQSSDEAVYDLPMSYYVHLGLRTNILNHYFDF